MLDLLWRKFNAVSRDPMSSFVFKTEIPYSVFTPIGKSLVLLKFIDSLNVIIFLKTNSTTGIAFL